MNFFESAYYKSDLNVSKLRVAQAELFNKIVLHSDLFSKDTKVLSGVVFLLSWIVGAGKTLAICVIGFAINKACGYPRVKKILVLAKLRKTGGQLVIVRFNISGLKSLLQVLVPLKRN